MALPEAQSVSVASGERLAAALGLVLAGVQRAAQACGLYEPTHPAVRSACEEAARHLREAPGTTDPLVVGLLQGRFVVDEEALPNWSDLITLADGLHSHDMAAIELSRSADAAALARLAAALQPGIDLAAEHAALARCGIRLIPVNYALLRFGERGGEEPQAARAMWLELRGLGAAGADAGAAEALAERLNTIADEQSTDLEACRGELRELARNAASAAFTDRARRFRELSRFLAGLSERLRRALVAVQSPDDALSFQLLEELIPTLPLGDVLEALEGVDHAQAAPPREALRLYRRLARLWRRAPAHRARIERLLARSAGPAEGNGNAELRALVAETLRSQGPGETASPDYDRQLDALGGAVHDWRERTNRAIDAAALRCRAAEIAASVLEGGSGGAVHGGAPADFLARVLTDLVRWQRVDLVLRATRALRLGAAGNRPADQAGAARLLERLSDSRFVQLLLDQVCEERCGTAECVELLRLGGATAMSRVLLRLAGNVPSEVRAALQGLVLEAGHEKLLGAVRFLACSGDDHLHSIFTLLGALPPQSAVDFLQPLCDHRESEVRRLAFHALAESGWVWPYRLLERALVDSEPSIFDLALERLRHQQDDLSTQLLERCLTGELNGRLPVADRFERLAATLAERPGGPRHLARVLQLLCSPPGLERAARGLRVAWILRRHRAEPEVRRALKRWLLSPAPLLALIPTPSDFGEDDDR